MCALSVKAARTLDLLVLVLQVAVGCHVGALILCRTASVSFCLPFLLQTGSFYVTMLAWNSMKTG